LTIAAIFGFAGLAASLYVLPVWMRKKGARIAILDDILIFERWMHDEHMYRGENAAEKAKWTIAEVSQKKAGRLQLAKGESDLSREAKLVAGAYKLFGAPGGLVFGEQNKHDAWLRNIEKRELDLPQGTVLLDDEEVLQLEDDDKRAGQLVVSQPSTPPTEEGGATHLAVGDTATCKPESKAVDPVRVVAELTRGTRFRPHLHGTMSAHQQESNAMSKYAQAMKKLQAETERREGKSDWESSRRGSERQRVPITIRAGKRTLTKAGKLSVGPGDEVAKRSQVTSIGARATGYRRKMVPL